MRLIETNLKAKKLFSWCFLVVCSVFFLENALWAYSSFRPPRRPGGENLRRWFVRDLRPYDERYLVLLSHKKLRSLIARAEALDLTPSQKAALEGLNKALEKEMKKGLDQIRLLAQKLERELEKEKPDLKRCQRIEKEIHQKWAFLSQKALKTLSQAYEIISSGDR